jgi:ATP adenylyltransferase
MPKFKKCLFCKVIKEKKDSKNFIIERGKFSFVILNKFPYSNGHIMIVPYKHTSDLEELDLESLTEIMSFAQKYIKILKLKMKPDGFNLGFNIGKVAGAGIEDHIHLHIVPRWNGDTNFMPVLSNTKVIPESLENVYKKLKK